MDLVIDRRGQVRCIYDEAFDLAALGKLSIKRASYVEPDVNGQWCVDLGPSGGPKLAGFGQRSQALTTEIAWLRQNWLTGATDSDRRSSRPSGR